MRFARAALAPLIRRSTYRRLMFLLLGSAAAAGFGSIGAIIGGVMRPPGWAFYAVMYFFPLLPALPAAIGIGLLRSTLVIQRTLARSLLGVPAADLPAGPDLAQPAGSSRTGSVPTGISWRHRWRSAGFFVLHVVAGYVFGSAVLLLAGFVLLTVAAFSATAGITMEPTAAEVRRFGPPIIATLLVLVPYGAALVGAGFARLAGRLLGPTSEERLAALEQQVQSLAEHNRLARELHDSVGHALSVVAVQANAAQRVLDRDPDVARTALAAIAQSARRALDDLDHVLALLRQQPGDATAPRTPQWTLADLPPLLADVRAAGLTVDLRCTGDLTAVPAVVSREAYRIVQEGLTNALRHAGPVPVRLAIRSGPAGLAVELSNRLPAGSASGNGSGGRGLVGIRERVALLGGTVTAGPSDGSWQMAVHLP